MKKRILSILLLCNIALDSLFFTPTMVTNAASRTKTYTLTMKVVGDCITHKELYQAAYKGNNSYDFSMYFEHIRDDITAADLAVINQETIFTQNRKSYSGFPKFATPVEVADAEVAAGFDIICSATNHSLDKGIKGIEDTLSYWRSNYPDKKVLGLHSSKNENDIAYIWKNNIRLAFVNYTNSLNNLEDELGDKEFMVDRLSDKDIERTLKRAKHNSDITIAILHVGKEYSFTPSSHTKAQVDRMIDYGADIVICNHPHVVNPYKKHTTPNGNTGIVYYSLGNFISGQTYVPRIIGGMANLTIKKTVSRTGIKKVTVSNYSMTALITHQENGYYTTYKLSDYSNDLWKKHLLYCSEFPTVESLNNMYKRILKGTQIQSDTGF